MSWRELVFGEETEILESEEITEEEILWRVVTALDERVTALDERVCPNCSPLEGEVFPESVLVETFPEAEEIAEGVLKLNVHAPRDYECRCYAMMEQLTEEYPIWGSNLELSSETMEAEVMQYNAWVGGLF